MKNKSQDLYNLLFSTLEDLDDKDVPVDVERVKAKVSVAQAIIEVAKTEVKFLESGGRSHTAFFKDLEKAQVSLLPESRSDRK
jgi:hypothetical protein